LSCTEATPCMITSYLYARRIDFVGPRRTFFPCVMSILHLHSAAHLTRAFPVLRLCLVEKDSHAVDVDAEKQAKMEMCWSEQLSAHFLQL
jgi:hypothetical protein